MTRSRPIIAAGTLAAVALLAACGSDDDDAADTITNPQVSLQQPADPRDEDQSERENDDADDDPNAGEGLSTDEGESDEPASQETAEPVASREMRIVNFNDVALMVRVEVMSLERGPGDVVRMDLRISNIDDAVDWRIGSKFSETGRPDLSGVSLVDLANDLRYLVLVDSEGDCVCTMVGGTLAPGEYVDARASFPALPEDVSEVDVHLGDLGAIGPVPVSDR